MKALAALRVAALASAFAFAALQPPARAAELQWSGRTFTMVASEKRLSDFLRELAASQGTTAVIDPKVDGNISGRFEVGRSPDAARKLLDEVTGNHGLTWYYDGNLLYVEPASEARQELMRIGPDGASRLQAAVQRMRIGDRRFTLQVSASSGTVLVAGPRRYVDAVRQLVRSLDSGGGGGRERSQVRVFPLRYAWANDFEIRRASGRGTLVPGVVSVLRGLYDPRATGGRGIGTGGSAGGAIQVPRVSGRRTLALPSGNTAVAPRLDVPDAGADDADLAAPFSAPARGDLPQFQADSRMNAVIVRDVPERMAEYAKLIESIDARPRLVEIEVTIMDISQDSLTRLGVDWRAHGSRADLQLGNGGTPALTWPGIATADGQTGSAAPTGGVFSAAIGNELRSFLLARVTALATQGEANFVARPKVLTLDNTEASIENKSEFYIKVPGFQDASLFTVQAGTEVRVVPLLVDDGGVRNVLLNMNIVDDSVGADMVDNVPVVRRRSVVSQAMVEEGKSVLLAGYSSEEKLNGSTGVPLLSAIPVVGALFRHEEKRRTNVERLYMLTPRYVLPDGTAQRPALPPQDGPAPTPGAVPAPAASAPVGNAGGSRGRWTDEAESRWRE